MSYHAFANSGDVGEKTTKRTNDGSSFQNYKKGLRSKKSDADYRDAVGLCEFLSDPC